MDLTISIHLVPDFIGYDIMALYIMVKKKKKKKEIFMNVELSWAMKCKVFSDISCMFSIKMS